VCGMGKIIRPGQWLGEKSSKHGKKLGPLRQVEGGYGDGGGGGGQTVR
jgi:hypothetical protein